MGFRVGDTVNITMTCISVELASRLSECTDSKNHNSTPTNKSCFNPASNGRLRPSTQVSAHRTTSIPAKTPMSTETGIKWPACSTAMLTSQPTRSARSTQMPQLTQFQHQLNWLLLTRKKPSADKPTSRRSRQSRASLSQPTVSFSSTTSLASSLPTTCHGNMAAGTSTPQVMKVPS